MSAGIRSTRVVVLSVRQRFKELDPGREALPDDARQLTPHLH